MEGDGLTMASMTIENRQRSEQLLTDSSEPRYAEILRSVDETNNKASKTVVSLKTKTLTADKTKMSKVKK